MCILLSTHFKEEITFPSTIPWIAFQIVQKVYLQLLYRKDYFVDGFSVYLIINSKCISRVQYETASVNFSIPIRVLNYAHAFYAGSLFIFLLSFILQKASLPKIHLFSCIPFRKIAK